MALLNANMPVLSLADLKAATGIQEFSTIVRADRCYDLEIKWRKNGKVGSAIFEAEVIETCKDIKALVINAIKAAEALEAIKP